MSISPDTKDWTWVLDEPCPDCHYDARTFTSRDVADMVRSNAAAWPIILKRDDAAIRPDETSWSAVEYAAHVRDVFEVFEGRFTLMLTQVDPEFPNWDQDATALEKDYEHEDAEKVSVEIVDAGDRLAEVLDSVGDEQWDRTGRRDNGSVFTIDTLAKYLIHDSLHHLWDVR